MLADRSLAAVRRVRDQPAFAEQVKASEWRAVAIKADTQVKYGGDDFATQYFEPHNLRPDGKTWTFRPSANCLAYEAAAASVAAVGSHDSSVNNATVAGYFTAAARMMWLHKLIIPRGYNGWLGDQHPQQGEMDPLQEDIVAKDITTPPHQSEMWNRVSRNYAQSLEWLPTGAESFVGKIFS